MALTPYMLERQAKIFGGRKIETTEKKAIAPVSEKRQKKLAEEKAERGNEDTVKEKWFKDRRKELTGTCQCGCGEKSQKKDNTYFRHSVCHIFPKAKFESVALHPANCVERAFFGGCHTNMDEQSMDKWVAMADWEDIKIRFHLLAPLLTKKEKATKFYSHLESLVDKN